MFLIFICIIKCSHWRSSGHFQPNNNGGNKWVHTWGWDPSGLEWLLPWHICVPTDFSESICSGKVLWVHLLGLPNSHAWSTPANPRQKISGRQEPRKTTSLPWVWESGCKPACRAYGGLWHGCHSGPWQTLVSVLVRVLLLPRETTIPDLKTQRYQSATHSAWKDSGLVGGTPTLPFLILLQRQTSRTIPVITLPSLEKPPRSVPGREQSLWVVWSRQSDS